MTWDTDRTAEVVHSYLLLESLIEGDRAARQRAEVEHWWAWEAVEEAVQEGDLPLTVLDAMLHDPAGSAPFRAYVAAGPIQELLADHQDAYSDAIAERCLTDEVWAQTVGGIWLDRDAWLSLPPDLRRLVPEPPVTPLAHSKRRARSPSKRQGRKPRHG